MFTVKSMKLIILFTSCFLFMTACFPSGSQNLSAEDDEKIAQDISDIVSENEHLSVDAELSDVPADVPTINVSVMEWDEDKLHELFLTERDYLEHYEPPSDYFSDSSYDVYMDEEKENPEAYWLVYEAGRITSEVREKFTEYGYGTLATALGSKDFGGYYTADSIGLFSKSDAINRADALLTELGIESRGEPQIFAITADKANTYFLQYNEGEYKEWTADDEIYVLSYPLEYEGINVTMNSSADLNAGGHGSYFVGTRIDLIVTKDEIISLRGSNLFSSEYEAGENIKINCTSQNALKIAAEYYDGIILEDSDIKITNCELVYVPYEQIDEKHFTLIPMWKIDTVMDSKDSSLNSCFYLFIDAQTGNRIVW